MTTWYKTTETPPTKNGMYLVIFRFDPLPNEKCGLYVDCAEWFNKGDKYMPDTVPQDGRSEYERVVGLLAGEYDIEIEEAGFYEQNGNTPYKLNVEFWAELPMTPEGRAGNAPEV